MLVVEIGGGSGRDGSGAGGFYEGEGMTQPTSCTKHEPDIGPSPQSLLILPTEI